MTLQINATGLVENYITRYLIWRDYQNFHKTFKEPIITISDVGIPCFSYWEIDKINNSSEHLVAIDCLTEGLHSRSAFDLYDTKKKYLIFSNGTWDQEYHKLKIDYVLIPHLFFLFEMADTYNSPNRFCYYSEKNYDFDSQKIYDFVTTIGNVRQERTYLVNKLVALKQTRKCIIRYSGEDYADSSNHLDLITFTPGNFDPYININKKYYYTVSTSLPMQMYNAARFNLVVESDINYEHCFFLTEKTIKVLLTGTPFVSMNHPNFLSKLHELGFSTYDSIWDESYDNIVEFDKRVNKIVELCDVLCDLDWEKHRKQLELIKFKNQTNFLNLNKLCDKEFSFLEETIESNI